MTGTGPGLILWAHTAMAKPVLNRYREPLNRRQIEILSRMTGEQRFMRALDMIRTAWRIAADAIRNDNPGITEKELRLKLRERRR